MVGYPLVPAVGFAGAVLFFRILQSPGLPGAPGQVDPGVGADGADTQENHSAPFRTAKKCHKEKSGALT